MEVGDGATTVAAADAWSVEKGTPAKVPGYLCGAPTSRARAVFPPGTGEGTGDPGHRPCAGQSPVDLELALTDAAGKALRTANEGPDETVNLDFNAPAAGVYCLAGATGS